MRYLILDTNIVSTLIKADLFHLVRAVFPHHKLLIPEAVEDELKRAGFEEPSLKCEKITPEEEKTLSGISGRHSGLGKGELECIAMAVTRDYPMLTNDRKAKNAALQEGVRCWGLPEFLRAVHLSGILTKEQLKAIVERIEDKDNIRFKHKERIYR